MVRSSASPRPVALFRGSRLVGVVSGGWVGSGMVGGGEVGSGGPGPVVVGLDADVTGPLPGGVKVDDLVGRVVVVAPDAGVAEEFPRAEGRGPGGFDVLPSPERDRPAAVLAV